MLRPIFATMILFAALAGPAQGHDLRQCHIHALGDGHKEPIPGCIQQGNRMYVPAECRVPEPSSSCKALMQRAVQHHEAAEREREAANRRWREEMKRLNTGNDPRCRSVQCRALRSMTTGPGSNFVPRCHTEYADDHPKNQPPLCVNGKQVTP